MGHRRVGRGEGRLARWARAGWFAFGAAAVNLLIGAWIAVTGPEPLLAVGSFFIAGVLVIMAFMQRHLGEFLSGEEAAEEQAVAMSGWLNKVMERLVRQSSFQAKSVCCASCGDELRGPVDAYHHARLMHPEDRGMELVWRVDYSIPEPDDF